MINFNSVIYNFIEYIKKKFIILKVKLSREYLVYPQETNPRIEYVDLGPVETIENTLEYYKALDWAFNNKRIFNIALAGPFGSGKSSIIKSYIGKHPELNYINISLANFLEYDENGELKLLKFDDSTLELGILKQLFYKVNRRKIPQSRYRKLYRINKLHIALYTTGIVALLAIFCMFFIPDFRSIIKQVRDIAKTNFGSSHIYIYPFAIIASLTTLYLISNVFSLFMSRAKIKEVNLADKAVVSTNETEDDLSIFNRNLDEIVYFFESTGYNVVILEDLDRFDNSDIFLKLRELNTILNNYEMIKKRIVFVYAIKDDMFIEKDRTKFFEFILPVIPVINSTNSKEILLSKIRSEDQMTTKFELSSDYITLISPYIDDMRILTNIYNEFLIYKSTLQGEQELNLTDQMMFSLMVFKNICPKDFADLQAERGIAKEAFNSKKELIKTKRIEFEDEQQKLIEILDGIDNDILNDIKEIKLSMLYYMTGYSGHFRSFHFSRIVYTFDQIMMDEFDLNLLKSAGGVDYWKPNNNNISTIRFDGEEQFNERFDYIKRCNILINNIPERKIEIQKQLQYFDEKINELSSLSLKDLMRLYVIEEFLPEEVIKNDLLVFLLRKGFVDEKYPNYLNYFYPNSVTLDDMNYILSIRNGKAESFDYELTKVRETIQELIPSEFEQPEIFNFDLLDYLIKTESEHEKCNLFIKQLANGTPLSWKFTKQYLDRSNHLENFLKLLGMYWGGFWDCIMNDNILLPEQKDLYFNLIFNYVEEPNLVAMNDNGNVANYFTENKDVLHKLENIPLEYVKSIIKECNVKFIDLDIIGVDNELLDWIFDNNYYTINALMLKIIVNYKNPEETNFVYTRNYTTLQNLNYTPLLEYIFLDFDKYINTIILELPNNTDESLESVLDIIYKTTDLDTIETLIQKENVNLDRLEKCNWEDLDIDFIINIWNVWIKYNKLIPAWENVVLYYSTNLVSSNFIDYLEYSIDQIVNQNCDVEIHELMVIDIIKSNMIKSKFEKIIQTLPLNNFDIPFTQINEEHMSALIDNKYFHFTSNKFNELKETYPDLVINCCIINKEHIYENLSDYDFDIEDIESIIETQLLTSVDKLKFLTCIRPAKCTTAIAAFLRNESGLISKEWFDAAWALLKQDEKYKLLLNQISLLSNDEISVLFNELGTEYKNLSDRSRRHEKMLHHNAYNMQLVEHLDKVDYLTSFEKKTVEKQDAITYAVTIEEMILCRIKKA